MWLFVGSTPQSWLLGRLVGMGSSQWTMERSWGCPSWVWPNEFAVLCLLSVSSLLLTNTEDPANIIEDAGAMKREALGAPCDSAEQTFKPPMQAVRLHRG